MKKFTSLLLCMVLVLSMFTLNATAAQNTWIEANGAVAADGTVTVTVTAKQAVANVRLNVTFNSDDLTYTGYETAFATHSVKAEGEKLTIGLANATANAVKAGETLVTLKFAKNGSWDKTSITVTAERWAGAQVNESVTVDLGTGDRFQDVTEGQWFYEAVEYMAAGGYIKGISATHFGPGLNMNRASFVTLLGRLAGVADEQVATQFVDVPVDSFYSGYVAWAAESGITTGVDATHFAPAASINRAQMVTFLYRYAASAGIDVTVEDPEAVLAAFSDAGELPEWAVAPFAWAVSNGIINGMEGNLAPNGTANRAQVAVMLYRFFFEG